MEHSIALVTGATSGLGHAAARLLAAEGYHEVIVTGHSLARIQATAAQLVAETKRQVFTRLDLDLTRRPAFSPRSSSWPSEAGGSISYWPHAGMVPGKKGVLTARRASRRLRPR